MTTPGRRLHPPRPSLAQQILTSVLNRAVRLAHQLIGLGTHIPPETQVWAELAPELTLRRIAQQTEAQATNAIVERPPSA